MEATAVTIRVPASSANIGTGFDCLGLALDLFASVTVTFSEAVQPPTNDVGEKMVLSAARAAYERIGRASPAGLAARYTVAIPLGRGLGASAVARVAGILAVNEREGHPLDEDACLALATDLEGHVDNACPALFGGVQACVETDEGFARVRCRYPSDLQIALLIPDHSMPTKEARRLLPDSYSRQDAIHTSSRLGLLVAALAAGRADLLDEATQDRFHQPQRSALFPPLYARVRGGEGRGRARNLAQRRRQQRGGLHLRGDEPGGGQGHARHAPGGGDAGAHARDAHRGERRRGGPRRGRGPVAPLQSRRKGG